MTAKKFELIIRARKQPLGRMSFCPLYWDILLPSFQRKIINIQKLSIFEDFGCAERWQNAKYIGNE